MNADDRTRHGGRDFPAEELFAEIVGFVHLDAHDRIAGPFQRLHG